MNRWNKFWTIFVGVMLCATIVRAAVDAPDQTARTLVRSWCVDVLGNHSQNSYGGDGYVSSSTVSVEVSARSAGGTEYIFSARGLIPYTPDPTVTTVAVTDPITGTGTLLDPLGIAVDGTTISIIAGELVSSATGGGTASGVAGDIQYSDGAGGFDADEDFTYDSVTDTMTVSSHGASISINGGSDTITSSSGGIGFDNENLTTTGWWAFNKWDITGTTPTGTYIPYVVSAAGDVATMGWIDPATLTTAKTETLDDAYNAYGAGTTNIKTIFADDGCVLINGTSATPLTAAASNAVNITSLLGLSDSAGADLAISGKWWKETTGSATHYFEYDVGGKSATADPTDFIPVVMHYVNSLGKIFCRGFQLLTGNEGAGKILACDANGVADWVPAVTDTDHEVIAWSLVAAGGTVVTASATLLISPFEVPYSGTVDHTGVYIGTWTPDTTNYDTITFTLYVDGSPTDTWATNPATQHAAGSYGGTVSEAITQGTGHTVVLYAQVTTQVGSLDTIKVNSGSIDVAIK